MLVGVRFAHFHPLRSVGGLLIASCALMLVFDVRSAGLSGRLVVRFIVVLVIAHLLIVFHLRLQV